MAVNTYDPGKVSVIWGPIIIAGFADGVMVSWEYNNPQAYLHVGTKGEASRAVGRDRSAKITVRLSQASSANDVLSIQAKIDHVTGLGALPFFIKDLSGTTVAGCDSAWLEKPPRGEMGKEISEREWVFETGLLRSHLGSN